MDCGSDQMNPFLHDPLPSSPSSKALESLFAAAGGDSSHSFHESSMANFRCGIPGRNARRRRSAEDEAADDEEEAEEEEELGIMYRQPGKKRRLAPGQVQYLERSFEMENKLEPERKNQLAKELGLQPRQVAIWFQNRRARFKTKQLERDYDSLKSSFDSLKSEFDHLLMEKEKLQNEVCLLKTKLKQREIGDSNAPIERPEAVAAAVEAEVTLLPCKQEAASSAKSDLSDSESPHCPETDHSTSRAYDAERSDFTQEGEDLTGSFLPVADYGFGKAEEGDFQGGSCSSLGLPGLEGQPSYWPWLY